MAKVDIKTKSGFEVSLDDNVLDDMELLEIISEMASNRENGIVKLPLVFKKMFGEKNKERLYDHVREKDGRVPVSKLEKIMFEIFEKLKSKK